MKLLQSHFSILILGILAVIAALAIGNSKLAMLISLVIAICSLLNKETGLLFLLVLIPIRPFLIAVNPGFKILGDAIIAFLLLRTIFDKRKDIKNLFTFHPFEWAFFAFAVIGVISAFLTGVSLKAIIFQLRAYFLFYIVFYVVKRMELSFDTIRKMSITSFILGVILSIHGFVEKIFHKTMLMPQVWQEWWLSPTNRIRVYGLIKGPNELSLFLVITFFISLYLLKHVQGKWRYFIYTGLTLIGTTILLTYSRGTLLTIVVFVVVYFVLSRKWRPFVSIGVVTFISAGLFFGINQIADQTYERISPYAHYYQQNGGEEGGAESGKRFKNTFSNEEIGQSSESGRIYYVKKAIEIFKDHPLIGTGFGTFGGAATLTYSSPVYEEYNIDRNFYSDNQYILILAETGALGMLSIFMTAYFLLVTTWKNRKEFYGPLLVYFIISLIVGSAVYNILENDSFMMYFFILFGLVYQKSKLANHP
ncbi:O-antigen ligase family protein [Neobacillus sp. NRS-1170]|uniref:O-antigen ligase family protein n=1 Tax=Neobacillus sp. NRS-1170 TaxID=3233898 RepID=UPI003D29EFE4